MKNICVYTWFNTKNYGTCLQSYALIKFLSIHGYNAYIPDTTKYYYNIKRPIESIVKLFYMYKDSLIRAKLRKIELSIGEDFKNALITRMRKNNQFAQQYSNIKHIKNKDEWQEMLNNTNIYLTGSDQIWNPSHVSPTNLLAFAKNSDKKIAYASSIGVEKIPFLKKWIYKKYLSRFSKIGVREKTAQIELSKLLKKDIVTVLDPTFLLNKENWCEIIDKNKCESLPDKKYIFCYFIGKNREWEKQIKEFAEMNGYEVICVLSEARIIPDVGIPKITLGPDEFVNYLMNADIIATDSFHAMALSINFNKKFVAYKRFNDDDNKSQNSRIIDILGTFELLTQIVDTGNTLDNILKNDIDYLKTNNILKDLRNFSEKFLISAIEES